MKPKDRASSADIQFIQSNPDARPRDLAKQLNLKQSVVTYWLKFVKPKKLTNKPEKKRKKIRLVSRQMGQRLALYNAFKAVTMQKVKACQVCGNTESLSIHHIAGRSGKLLYDPENFLVVCMAGSTYLNEKYPESNQTEGCHPWIERNLKLARELGYSKSKIRKQND